MPQLDFIVFFQTVFWVNLYFYFFFLVVSVIFVRKLARHLKLFIIVYNFFLNVISFFLEQVYVNILFSFIIYSKIFNI